MHIIFEILSGVEYHRVFIYFFFSKTILPRIRFIKTGNVRVWRTQFKKIGQSLIWLLSNGSLHKLSLGHRFLQCSGNGSRTHIIRVRCETR